jgi:hypothetical protein
MGPGAGMAIHPYSAVVYHRLDGRSVEGNEQGIDRDIVPVAHPTNFSFFTVVYPSTHAAAHHITITVSEYIHKLIEQKQRKQRMAAESIWTRGGSKTREWMDTCSTTTNLRAASLASASTTESSVFITHAPCI